MGSKQYVLFALSLAILILSSSQVAAGEEKDFISFLTLGLSLAIVILISLDLPKPTQNVATDGRSGYNNIGSDGNHNGGGRGCYLGSCHHNWCCIYAGEVFEPAKYSCHHNRCCKYEGEVEPAKDTTTAVKP